jgi:hypothetical protein
MASRDDGQGCGPVEVFGETVAWPGSDALRRQRRAPAAPGVDEADQCGDVLKFERTTMVDHRSLILKVSLASETGVIFPNFRFASRLLEFFQNSQIYSMNGNEHIMGEYSEQQPRPEKRPELDCKRSSKIIKIGVRMESPRPFTA